MTTAPAAIAGPPTFAVHGEWSPAAISALARILIAHARREIEAERVASRNATAGAARQAGDEEHDGGQDR